MNKALRDVSATSTVPLWIDGRPARARGSRRGDLYNPADGQVTGRVPFASSEDVDDAVAAAERAFPGWRATTPLHRARVLSRFRELLQKNREKLARIISEEHGKTVADAVGSVQRGIEVVEFATGVPHLLKGEHAEDVGTGIDCHSTLQPIGVCAGITPRRAPVPERDRGRHGRRQRPDSCADGDLSIWWMEIVAVRRSPHPRHGRRVLLHAHQSRHESLD